MIKQLLSSYRNALTEDRDLCNLRLLCTEKPSFGYDLLSLRVKWIEFKIKLMGDE